MHFNRTKLIATLGPASRDHKILMAMVKAGVDVFRLNFSHGTHAEHKETIESIRSINRELETHVGILADLQGPKIRIGEIEGGKVEIKENDVIKMTTKECVGTNKKVYITYSTFPSDVKAGEVVLVDDGKIEMQVIDTNRVDTVNLKVLHGGMLGSKKGVNLPNTKVSIPSLTEKDLKDLDFILEQDVNWIALSFVRSPKDMVGLKAIIESKGKKFKVIAKIEKPEAVECIDDIIDESDAIMIARGDLGVEVPIDKMTLIQKDIVNRCRQNAKPVIIATQMMENMILHPKPSRAEISDVTNAVFDGADTLMLSGETSVGKYPVIMLVKLQRTSAQKQS